MMQVGIVGWRGMVGSVLMQRMRAEGDFDLVEGLLASGDHSEQTGAGPKLEIERRRWSVDFGINVARRFLSRVHQETPVGALGGRRQNELAWHGCGIQQ